MERIELRSLPANVTYDYYLIADSGGLLSCHFWHLYNIPSFLTLLPTFLSVCNPRSSNSFISLEKHHFLLLSLFHSYYLAWETRSFWSFPFPRTKGIKPVTPGEVLAICRLRILNLGNTNGKNLSDFENFQECDRREYWTLCLVDF